MKITVAAFFLPVFQLLVGILDLDNRAIHQHPNRDGDSRQRHDVGSDPHEIHWDKGQRDGHGNGDDRHQGGGDVPQEK